MTDFFIMNGLLRKGLSEGQRAAFKQILKQQDRARRLSVESTDTAEHKYRVTSELFLQLKASQQNCL